LSPQYIVPVKFELFAEVRAVNSAFCTGVSPPSVVLAWGEKIPILSVVATQWVSSSPVPDNVVFVPGTFVTSCSCTVWAVIVIDPPPVGGSGASCKVHALMAVINRTAEKIIITFFMMLSFTR
jgi:hypothetical protein